MGSINAGIGKTMRGKNFLKVVGFFIVWYVFGAISNIYCKEFLKATEDPILLTLCQYLISVILTSSFLLYYNNTSKKGHHDVMDPPSSFDIPNAALKLFVLIGDFLHFIDIKTSKNNIKEFKNTNFIYYT